MTPAKPNAIFRVGADKRTESYAVDVQRLKLLTGLIRRGEGSTLEFKAKANHPDKIARSLVSFANSSGGTLLLGVNDNGELSGVKYPEEDVAVIARILRGANPRMRWKYEVVALSAKKWVVLFTVSESRRKPVFLRQDKGLVFVRIEDETLQAGAVTAEILRQRTSSVSLMTYDEQASNLLKNIPEGGSITPEGLSIKLRLSRKLLVSRLAALVAAGVLKIRLEAGQEFLSIRNGD